MRIAIIGCGNMGTCIAKQLSPFHQMILYDKNLKSTQSLAQKIHAQAYSDPIQTIEQADVIILAIKPQNLEDLTLDFRNHFKSHQILLSLLAGTSSSLLKNYFPHPIIVRIMPNLAVSEGAGVVGAVETSELSAELKNKIHTLLSPLGLIYWLDEKQMDALTSLTGSGPAFILAMIEAMVEAGIAMGFQFQEAQMLVLQMLQGCTTLLQNSHQHPGELKWRITSPNGTTIAGLRELEKANVRSGIIETFLASYERTKALAKDLES